MSVGRSATRIGTSVVRLASVFGIDAGRRSGTTVPWQRPASSSVALLTSIPTKSSVIRRHHEGQKTIAVAHPCADPGFTPDQLFGLRDHTKRVVLRLSDGLGDRRM